jgi:hypothetical protein
MEVNDVFSAAPKSVMDVLCEPNVGYYIPAYQREYDWGVGHIQRLFEDSTHGLKLLVEQQDAITFLGTLILIHDTRYTTIEPQVRGDLPARVYLVIDGQQRLTTLLLMSAILHEEIKRRAQDFSGSQNPAENWLFNQTVELDAMLQQCFRIDMFRGQGVHQFYPRMILSYLDSWSRQPSQANYLSPIARYLHSYVSHIAARSTTVHRYEPPDDAPQDVRNLHTVLKRNVGAIRTQTRQVADGINPDLEMPDLRELCDRSELQRILFTTDLEDSVKAILRSNNDAFHVEVVRAYPGQRGSARRQKWVFRSRTGSARQIPKRQALARVLRRETN